MHSKYLKSLTFTHYMLAVNLLSHLTSECDIQKYFLG